MPVEYLKYNDETSLSEAQTKLEDALMTTDETPRITSGQSNKYCHK